MNSKTVVNPAASSTEASDPRTALLLAMYKEMWANINRHVTVLWQAVGTLATGGLAALAFAANSEGVGSGGVDLISSLAVFTSGWVAAHAFDTSEWFNRNIQIIGNIERELLREADDSVIHPYIGSTRSNEMIQHFRIQVWFAGGVSGAVLLVHGLVRFPDLGFDTWSDCLAFAPLVATVVSVHYVCKARDVAKEGLEKFAAKLEENASEPSA